MFKNMFNATSWGAGGRTCRADVPPAAVATD